MSLENEYPPFEILADLVGDSAVAGVYKRYISKRFLSDQNPAYLTPEGSESELVHNAGRIVLKAYTDDLADVEAIKSSRKGWRFDKRPDNLSAPYSLTSDMMAIVASLEGKEWVERINAANTQSDATDRRGHFLGALQTLASEGVALKILDLSPRKVLFSAGSPQQIIEREIIDRAPELSEETTGTPVKKLLAVMAIAFAGMNAVDAAGVALHGSLQFAQDKDTRTIYSLNKKLNLCNKALSANIGPEGVSVLVPIEIMDAADFAIELANNGNPRNKDEKELDKIQEAILHYNNQVYDLLNLAGSLAVGSGGEVKSVSLDMARQDELKRQTEQKRIEAERLRKQQTVERQQKEAKDQTDYQNLLNELEPVIIANDEQASSWLLSSNEIRKRGLNGIVGSLVRGLKDEDGEIVFAGVSKENARQLISTIEQIRSLFAMHKNKTKVSGGLDSRYNVETGISKQLGEIVKRTKAISSKHHELIRKASPKPFSTKQLVDELGASYKNIRGLITQDHPSGINLASQLDELFEPDIKVQPDILSTIPLPEAIDPDHELISVADQLDQIILPTDATIEDVKAAVEHLTSEESELAEIEWERLFDLVKLRNMYDGKLFRSKSGSLGGAPPYFVLEICYDGRTFAVAESPIEGNATYIVDEKEVGGSWLEALTYSKAEVRVLGGHRIIHRNKTHMDKIETCILDLLTVS